MASSDCSNNFPFANGTISPLQRKVTLSIISILIAVIIISNVLLINLLFKTKQLNLVTNYFVLAMSISDTCTGSILLPLIIVKLQWLPSSKIMNVTLLFLINLLVNFSAFMVLTIAIDRYVHIHCMRGNRALLSRGKAKIVIAGSFIFSSGFASCISTMFYTKNTKALMLGICVYGTIVLFLVILLYMGLYCKVRRSAWKISSQRANSRRRRPRHAVFLTNTVIFILVSLACCYLPYLIMGIIIFFQSKETCINTKLVSLFAALSTLMYIYAAINAWIIIFRNRVIKNFILGRLDLLQNFTETEQRSVNQIGFISNFTGQNGRFR